MFSSRCPSGKPDHDSRAHIPSSSSSASFFLPLFLPLPARLSSLSKLFLLPRVLCSFSPLFYLYQTRLSFLKVFPLPELHLLCGRSDASANDLYAVGYVEAWNIHPLCDLVGSTSAWWLLNVKIRVIFHFTRRGVRNFANGEESAIFWNESFWGGKIERFRI